MILGLVAENLRSKLVNLRLERVALLLVLRSLDVVPLLRVRVLALEGTEALPEVPQLLDLRLQRPFPFLNLPGDLRDVSVDLLQRRALSRVDVALHLGNVLQRLLRLREPGDARPALLLGDLSHHPARVLLQDGLGAGEHRRLHVELVQLALQRLVLGQLRLDRLEPGLHLVRIGRRSAPRRTPRRGAVALLARGRGLVLAHHLVTPLRQPVSFGDGVRAFSRDRLGHLRLLAELDVRVPFSHGLRQFVLELAHLRGEFVNLRCLRGDVRVGAHVRA
mmetsp:Transcript_13018/g.55034  ORF Transcript_13018/g.55034 Transcript_13018/m.55034 type:complete len:277 (+) Transcript_13018:379-1209(+)